MKNSKSLIFALDVKSFYKWTFLYSLSGLVLVFFFLQVITNKPKEVNSIYHTTFTEFEKQYRKRFNLMIEKPADVGEECTLGNLSITLLYLFLIS